MFSAPLIYRDHGGPSCSYERLEKIAKVEQQLAQGKVLDAEQEATLTSKRSIEKSLLDIQGLKQQLEEVAREV